METKKMLITPEIAEKLLKKNKSNRPISQRIINEYSRVMANGGWFEDTGESIKIDPDGTLFDGQHRLMALINAKVNLYFEVATKPIEAFKFIDQGKKRNASDIFACEGVTYYRTITAGLKKYIALKKGISISRTGGCSFNLVDIKFSNAEILNFYHSNPEVFQGAASNSDNWYRKSGKLLAVSEIMGYYLYFRDKSIDDSFSFMQMMCEGIDLTPGNPILLLRRRLNEDKLNTRYKLSTLAKTAFIIKTWNYYRNRQPLGSLRFNPETEKFPIAI
jgi:hypothetical protein